MVPRSAILRDISLSFFPGAKIGVLDYLSRCSGKSSLLKIMAWAWMPALTGRRARKAGIRIGFLPQEPQLEDAKDVRTTVMEGVGETSPAGAGVPRRSPTSSPSRWTMSR